MAARSRKGILKRLDRFDWQAIEATLDQEGQAVLRELLSGAECQQFAEQPLPEDLRAALYEKLVPIADRWNKAMGLVAFPLRVMVLLSEPGRDFTGGELVMIEQRPRMQSRPMVVSLRRGDAAVFAVRHRPVKGARGIYRVNLRHEVSRVRSGERIAIDLVFDDAP